MIKKFFLQLWFPKLPFQLSAEEKRHEGEK